MKPGQLRQYARLLTERYADQHDNDGDGGAKGDKS